MSWICLIVAGLFEVAWAYSLKQSQGFTRLAPSTISVLTAIGSFYLLSLSMKTIPLGTAYAVFTGIGAIGAFLVGILLLGESFTTSKMIAALLIISGLLLMKLSYAK